MPRRGIRGAGYDLPEPLLDPDGTLVWATQANSGSQGFVIAPDGVGVILAEPDQDGRMRLRQVAWTGEDVWSTDELAAHHHIAVVDSDTIAILGTVTMLWHEGQPDEVQLIGDTILEVDHEGATRQIWNIFDDVDPDEAPCNFPATKDGKHDWSHANYLRWVPEQDAYLVVSRHLDAIFSVDRSEGELTRVLSNTWGDFQAAPGEMVLDHPHSVEPMGDDLLVFNQKDAEAGRPCSEAVRLALDEVAGTASVVWRYQADPCVDLHYLGNAWPLPDDGVLVTFSQKGLMDQVDAAGDLLQRWSTEMSWQFAYATWTDSLYVPEG